MDKPTRRVRGNSAPPPDEELPISYWQDDPEAEDDARIQTEIEETIALFWFFVIIICVTVLLMFAWGKLP